MSENSIKAEVAPRPLAFSLLNSSHLIFSNIPNKLIVYLTFALCQQSVSLRRLIIVINQSCCVYSQLVINGHCVDPSRFSTTSVLIDVTHASHRMMSPLAIWNSTSIVSKSTGSLIFWLVILICNQCKWNQAAAWNVVGIRECLLEERWIECVGNDKLSGTLGVKK